MVVPIPLRSRHTMRSNHCRPRLQIGPACPNTLMSRAHADRAVTRQSSTGTMVTCLPALRLQKPIINARSLHSNHQSKNIMNRYRKQIKGQQLSFQPNVGTSSPLFISLCSLSSAGVLLSPSNSRIAAMALACQPRGSCKPPLNSPALGLHGQDTLVY